MPGRIFISRPRPHTIGSSCVVSVPGGSFDRDCSDVLVLLYRQIWERELHSLAEGRPLKQWHRPERVETVYGA